MTNIGVLVMHMEPTHCAICNGEWVRIWTHAPPPMTCPYCGYTPPKVA